MRIGWLLGGIAGLGVIGAGAALMLARPAAPPPAAPRRVILAPADPAPRPIAELRAAADRAPGDAGAWVRLGDAHLRARGFHDAIAAYRHALAIDPGRSETWSALGEAHIQSERGDGPAMPAAAKQAFARALALDPGDMRARFYAIMERDFQGQHDRAIGEWLQMLREAPMGSDADEAIRAAIAASVNRNLALVKAEMARATQAQPRVRTGTPAR